MIMPSFQTAVNLCQAIEPNAILRNKNNSKYQVEIFVLRTVN